MTRRKTHDEFVIEFNELSKGEYTLLGTYQTTHKKVEVKHETCGNVYEVAPSKFLTGRRCPNCQGGRISKSKIRTSEEFSKVLNELRNGEFQLVGEYKGKQKTAVKHKLCGKEFDVTSSNILHRKSGCPHCYGHKTTDVFIESVKDIYGNKYEVLGEYRNNRIKILVRHNDCGYEWNVIPKDFLKGHGCPKCQSSKGEEFLRDWFIENGIKFEEQVRFKDCRNKLPLPFDFRVWLDNGDFALIEFDGSQHFGHSNYWGNKDGSKSVKLHDEIKNNYCEDKGIRLLRIPYWWLRNERIYRELENLVKV